MPVLEARETYSEVHVPRDKLASGMLMTTRVPGEIVRLRLALLRLARRIRQNAESELSPSQQSIVAVLDRYGPMKLGELATIESIQPPSITRAMRALVEQGIVKRQQVDGRQVEVSLTKKGREAAVHVHHSRDEWLTNRYDKLNEAERQTLKQALPALERLLDT